jgi:hypothetical protein
MASVIGQIVPRHRPMAAVLGVSVVERAQMQLRRLAREDSEPDHEDNRADACPSVRQPGNR